MMRKNRLQLKIKLNTAELMLIIIIPIMFMGLFSLLKLATNNSEKQQIQMVTDSMSEISHNQRQEFSSYISAYKQTLIALSRYKEVYEMNRAVQKEFLQGHAPDYGFRNFFIVNSYGMSYYIDQGEYIIDHSNELFFYNLKQADEYVTTPLNTDNGPIITICEAIYNGKQRVGTLCGVLNLSRIQDKVSAYEGVLGSKYFIVDRQGTYIAYRNGDEDYSDLYNLGSIYKNDPDDDLDVIASAFDTRSDREGLIKFNDETLYSYVSYFPDCDWVIIQCLSIESIEGISQNIRFLEFTLISITIILLLVIFRVLYKWWASDNKIHHDVLTGLYSRAGCYALTEQLDKNPNDQIAVIYMDLNRFKYVNDTYGHDTGDALLKQFASVLKSQMKNIGFPCRIGGDEFIVFLKGYEREEVEEVVARLSEEWANTQNIIDSSNYEMTFAYGIEIRKTGSMTSMSRIIEIADERMYLNKQAGRNAR